MASLECSQVSLRSGAAQYRSQNTLRKTGPQQSYTQGRPDHNRVTHREGRTTTELHTGKTFTLHFYIHFTFRGSFDSFIRSDLRPFIQTVTPRRRSPPHTSYAPCMLYVLALNVRTYCMLYVLKASAKRPECECQCQCIWLRCVSMVSLPGTPPDRVPFPVPPAGAGWR